MKIQPSDLCTDAEFLRRVYLDLTGLPPTADDVRAFLADTRDSRVKRDELVDKLIGSKEFVEYWTNKWADLLQVNRKFLGVEGAVAFRKWIRDQVAANTPYDQFVRAILTAERLEQREPGGVVLQDPPRPGGDDGEHDAAVPGRPVQLQQVPRPPVRALDPGPVLPDGRLLRPGRPEGRPGSERPADRRHGRRGGQAALRDRLRQARRRGHARPDQARSPPPKFPFPCHVPGRREGHRGAQELAAWITSQDNPYFARSYVNRLWGYLFGVGIIEPLDDIRAGNPADQPRAARLPDRGVHQERLRRPPRHAADLQVADLSALGRDEQVERGRQDQLLARDRPAAAGRGALRRGLPGDRRRLEDSRACRPGTRAAELPDSGVELPSGFLATFGRPARESACECERTSGLQLGPVMALVSGPTIGDAIADPKNELDQARRRRETDDAKLVDELFLRDPQPARDRRPRSSACLKAIAEIDADHAKLAEALGQREAEVALEPAPAGARARGRDRRGQDRARPRTRRSSPRSSPSGEGRRPRRSAELEARS